MIKIFRFFSIFLAVWAFGGCSKYEEGPFLSLRSKNARLEGKWKAVGYESKYTDTGAPEDNETYSLAGSTMTYQFTDVTFDPWTGQPTYTLTSTSYNYSLTFEFDTKDNVFKSSEISGTSTYNEESYWSWQDGANDREMIEIDGQQFIIKKLTNKELILYLDISYSDASSNVMMSTEIKFEKE